MPELSEFAERIGVRFHNLDLLKTAFVHRSYLNENPGFELPHNERLEFLGDAVLELIVTEHLYRSFPNPEGELTNWRSALVRGEMLSRIATGLGMDDYLFLSRGESRSGGKARSLILANATEAVIGAVYLDQGYESAKEFIHKYVIAHLPEILEQELHIDAKSKLQEWAQEQRSQTPHYKVLSEEGPDHDKVFTIGVFLGDELVGQGVGPSKQAAQQEAATAALSTLRK
jgi:ribonuclease-3